MKSILSAALFGAVVGLAFGSANLFFTFLDPLSDDSVSALLLFYGPMLSLFGVAAFLARRATGSFRWAVLVGATVGAASLAVFQLVTLVRVNLFLDVLSQRADWQGLMSAYRQSGAASLRAFVNSSYLIQTFPKVGAGVLLGATLGFIGAALGGFVPSASPAPSRRDAQLRMGVAAEEPDAAAEAGARSESGWRRPRT